MGKTLTLMGIVAGCRLLGIHVIYHHAHKFKHLIYGHVA